MVRAYGLYGHIQANRLRSALLLLAFVALLHALLFSLLLIWGAAQNEPIEVVVRGAARRFGRVWPIALLVALAWFAIAYRAHQALIERATGARSIARRDAPALHDALENLCISRGLTTPALQIIETDALNAYASGLREGHYRVAVTRGLVDALSRAELEAVLAHELTHIRNRDTQLMVVAVIFAGIFAFAGDLLIRRWDFPYGWSPAAKRRPDGSGREGALLAQLFAATVFLLTWGASVMVRFALSRSREFLADAGSAELTKAPEALVSALRKIQGRAGFDVPSRMEAFFIESPVAERIAGLLSTHPSIEERIDALERFAGARPGGGPAS